MNDFSFYGGKQGFSFIIVKSFPDIKTMKEAFSKGAAYTAVHYDEHVLINMENKNHPDNGKVFRRGYDYTDEEYGGGVYVGTIVGPAGPAPMLEMTTIDDILKKYQDTIDKYGEDAAKTRFSEGEYAPTENLVPGKYLDEHGAVQYNDKIEYKCLSIRDENGTDTTAWIGFKFPYMVLEYTAESVSPYYNRNNNTDNFVNQNLIKRTDSAEHPYYQSWHFSVPKGIKGDAFKNFRVVKMNASNKNLINYQDDDSTKKQDDVDNQRDVLVYDYYHYDKDESGEPVSLYLGDYNMIEDILFAEDGTVTVQYTHDDDDVYSKLIKWIKSVTLDNTGKFTVLYNYDEKDGVATKYEASLAWVNKIEITQDGQVKTYFSNGGGVPTIQTERLKWVEDFTLAANGIGTIKFNDGTTKPFENVIKWITNVNLNTDGKFSVTFNNGDIYETYIKAVEDIYIQTETFTASGQSNGEGSGDQKVHIKYNLKDSDGNNVDEAIGNPLNYIIDMKITDTDKHLVVYYSDPEKRQEIVDANLDYKFAVNNKFGWLDLGPVKSDNGILVGKNIEIDSTNTELVDIAKAIAHLNTNYPNGLQGAGLEGKIITIGTEDGKKKFYAYDYTIVNTDPLTYRGWYYLGDLDVDMGTVIMVAAQNDPIYAMTAANLKPGGVWFIVDNGEDAGNDS